MPKISQMATRTPETMERTPTNLAMPKSFKKEVPIPKRAADIAKAHRNAATMRKLPNGLEQSSLLMLNMVRKIMKISNDGRHAWTVWMVIRS